MRRIVMLGALVALMVSVVATAAYAATIFCTTDLCTGTVNNDTIYDDPDSSEIRARAGADVLRGDNFLEDGEDLLYGQRGNDLVDGADFDTADGVSGGRGTDVCHIDRNTQTGDRDATAANCETVKVSAWAPGDI